MCLLILVYLDLSGSSDVDTDTRAAKETPAAPEMLWLSWKMSSAKVFGAYFIFQQCLYPKINDINIELSIQKTSCFRWYKIR